MRRARARSFYIILSGRVGIFINTDLSAGGPGLANGGGADQRASPNDEASNRAALGNYIKSLGARCSNRNRALVLYAFKCCHTHLYCTLKCSLVCLLFLLL